jgi:MFS family permease
LAVLLDEREAPFQTGTAASPSSARPDDRPAGGEDRPAGGPWSRHYRLLTLGLLLTVVAWAFEALAVATILPATVDDLGGLHLYGWIFSAFMLTNLLGVAAAGGEVDRRGPAAPFLVGIALFIAGLLIGGGAPTMAVLIFGRAVQGLGSGILGAVVYAVIGRGYPEAVRPRMLALSSSAWVIPGLIGPAVAGVVADVAGWRWVFFGILPFPILAVLLATKGIRRIPPGAAGPGSGARDWSRIRNALYLAAGMTALLAGLGCDLLLLAVPLVAAGAAVALPALRRLLPPGTLRGAPGLPAAVASIALLNLGFFGVDAFLPLALIDVRGRSTAFAGLALTAATITWTTGSWIVERRARRSSRRALVRVGLTLVAIGSAGAALVLLPGVPVLLGPVAWGVAGLGIGLAYSTIQLVVLETAPAGQEGTATSAMQLANTVGIALAAGVGGALIAALSVGEEASRASIAIQDLLMIGVTLLGIVVAGRLPDRRPATGEDAYPTEDDLAAARPMSGLQPQAD